jgi:hypothetical protein
MQLAEVYGASNLTAYANGIAGTPTTTVTPYVSSTTQVIGALQTQASQFAYAWVAVLYFPRALSAQELLTLASICTGKVAA